MHKRYLWALIILLAYPVFNSCKTAGGLAQAKLDFDHEQYADAAKGFKAAYTHAHKKEDKADIAFRMAESLRKERDFKKAENWYRKAIDNGYTDPIAIYDVGEMLKMQENYEEAVKEFEEYQKNVPSDTRAQEQIDVCKSVQDWVNNAETKSRFDVDNFKQANSPYNDFSPMLLHKNELYFTSDRKNKGADTKAGTFGRTGFGYTDIYVMTLTGGGKGKNVKATKWSAPVPVPGDVNTPMNEGTVCFDAKGSAMYYTQCNGPKGNEKKMDTIKNCVIMMAKRKAEGWGDGEKLNFCTDSLLNYGHPTLSPDGNKLVFAMSDPDHKGTHDLYQCTYIKRTHNWSDPVSLGPIINTPGDEVFPYFYDDTTLYFSSDGHIGMGGLDIFVTYGEGTTWTKPKNLKYPLNSGGDDFGIVFDDTKASGFFTSNRTKVNGNAVPAKVINDDIYSFKIRPMVLKLEGIVYDTTVTTHQVVMKDATVTLVNHKDNTRVNVKTNAKGEYSFTLKAETDYTVFGSKKTYHNSMNHNLSTKGIDYTLTLHQDLNIAQLPLTSLNIRGIYYDVDKYELKPESKKTLDSLVEELNTYPYIVVEIGSHTDCRSSYQHNDTLSQNRSNSVVKYLVSHGIDSGRLVPKGYGETQLLNNCACENGVGPGMNCTEEEHAINRRTTFKILRFDFTPKDSGKKEDENDNQH